MNHDKSTVMMAADGSPWYSTNRKVAEAMVEDIHKMHGRTCYAIPHREALKLVMVHPKNQPK